MKSSSPRIRAIVEASSSVAEVRLVVQLTRDAQVPWRWDVPYALWAAWGTARTARWIADQFYQHDTALARRTGVEALRQTVRQALDVHRRFFQVAWLADLTS